MSFDPIGDYEFVSWKITNDTTNEELPNGEYLKIEDVLNSETKCTFVKAPEPDMKLCLSPVVTERPQILSYAPMLGTEMSFKDSAIQVVFDYPMDPDSIYYTQAEFDELMAQLNLTDKNDPALLRTTITKDEAEQTKYYGYIKDGKTYFKNISITASETGESLTGFFEAPSFVVENKLVIKVKDCNSLPDYGEIQVELDKDFFYTLNGKPITMAGNKKWIYQINESRDNVGPVINKIEVKCGDKTLEVKDPYTVNKLPKATIKQLAFSNSTSVPFAFNVRARDTGNGLGSKFYVYYKRIYDSSYQKTVSNVKSFSVPFESMTSYDASFNGNYIEELRTDGVYELTFCFEDSLGNRTYYPDDKWKANSSTSWTKSYVISVDTTPPKNSAKGLIYNNNTIYLIIYENDLYPDLEQYGLMYKPVNQENYNTRLYSLYKYGEDYWPLGINNEQDNDFCIQLIDYAGNSFLKDNQKIPSRLKFGEEAYFFAEKLIASNHEVTQKEYGQYMTWYGYQYTDSGWAPSDTYGKGDNFPANFVNWYEAIIYCNLRSMAEGLTPVYYLGEDVNNYDIADWAQNSATKIANIGTGENIRYYYNDNGDTTYNDVLDNVKVNANADGYRLPTEREWEYLALRAYLNKNEDGSYMQYAGTNEDGSYGQYAWNLGNSEGKIHEVKTKKSNGAGGLFDMNGNVCEWCFDKKSTSKDHIHKGGSFSDNCTKISSSLGFDKPSTRSSKYGFRVVRTYIPQ